MVYYQVLPLLFLCRVLVMFDCLVTRQRILLQKLLYSYQFLIWLFLIQITALSKTVATELEVWNSEHAASSEPKLNVINLFRLPHRDDITVALKPVHGEIARHIHNIVLWHFAACASMNYHTSQYPGHEANLHPQWVKLYPIGCVESGLMCR